MEQYTPQEWVVAAKSNDIRKHRTVVLRYWVNANGFKDATDRIKLVEGYALYHSFEKAMQFIEKTGALPALYTPTVSRTSYSLTLELGK
jgi:hypothetical protein